MIRLEHLKKNKTVIECDVIPEDSIRSGHIAVDLESREVVEYILPKGYEWCKNHINHAKNALLDISNKEPLPESKTIMWY